ncbi:MAG: hypothetical protein HC910_22110 [Spirulinaceae cyanobacterium SM2_1_0]|nr:hypothetical protein [Spirulinaceae cyanobacterium SM2_1_0]
MQDSQRGGVPFPLLLVALLLFTFVWADSAADKAALRRQLELERAGQQGFREGLHTGGGLAQ